MSLISPLCSSHTTSTGMESSYSLPCLATPIHKLLEVKGPTARKIVIVTLGSVALYGLQVARLPTRIPYPKPAEGLSKPLA